MCPNEKNNAATRHCLFYSILFFGWGYFVSTKKIFPYKLIVPTKTIIREFLSGHKGEKFDKRNNLIDNENEVWVLSPYPNGYNFAFTIVHDADYAYSKRLEPIFRVFNELGLKITATVFIKRASEEFEASNIKYLKSVNQRDRPFWGYRNVPLSEEEEKGFYKRIAALGHEIGMHTPSATSDTRETVIQSFERFKKVFGSYPKIYVEHWGEGNKETQGNEGANPQSPYYCTDLLNHYRCWVWAIPGGLAKPSHKKFYNILAVNGSPFSDYALKKFGIVNGFLRSGQYRHGDGDGFLEWYSRENIDALEKERGLALVYAHLDIKWLDKKTRKMRKKLEKRLHYLASKDGWFVPAGKILDRFKVMRNIFLSYNIRDKWLKVTNVNPFTVDKVTLISQENRWLKRIKGEVIKTNDDHEIILDSILPFETISFSIIPSK